MNTFWVGSTPVYKLLVFSVPRNVMNSYLIVWVDTNAHGDANNYCSSSYNIHATKRNMREFWGLRSGAAEHPVLLGYDAASVVNRYRRLEATHCPHLQASFTMRTICRHETPVSITDVSISVKNRIVERNIIITNVIYGIVCWIHWLSVWCSGGSLQSQWKS